MTSVVERHSSPHVDPRLRARRIEVRRAEGRRRLRRLLALVVVTTLCAAAWGISRSPLLDVDHIEVVGTDRLSVDAIVERSGIDIGDPLVDLDLGGARDTIAAMPWVESVDVTRSWLGTVVVEVVERRPAAVVHGADAAPMLVDPAGWILDVAAPSDRSTLPSIEGVSARQVGERLDPADQVAVDLVVRAGPELMQWVGAVTVADDGIWIELRPEPVLAAGGTVGHPGRVHLGDGRDLPDQLLAAETVLARVDLSCLAVIDVRVPASPVVRRAEGCIHGDQA
jgi:hypothetical protein